MDCCNGLDPCPMFDDHSTTLDWISDLRATLRHGGKLEDNIFLQLYRDWWKEYQVPWAEESLRDLRIVKRTTGETPTDLFNSEKWEGWLSDWQINGGMLPPGTWTTLMAGKTMWMTDTPSEIVDLMEPLSRSYGRVLINGLGLGVLPYNMLKRPCVQHVDIVEKDKSVIELIGKYFDDPRVTLHYGDALNIGWKAGERWDVIWHDIWPTISADNWEEMKKLKRRYRGRCSWQAAWRERTIREMVKGTDFRYAGVLG